MGAKRRPKTSEERDVASRHGRARWTQIKTIAAHFVIRPQEVLAAWTALRQAGLVAAEGDRPLDMLAIGKALAAQRQQLSRPKVLGMPKPDTAPVETELSDRLGIMFWAIKKCGGIEKARDAFERAMRALENP